MAHEDDEKKALGERLARARKAAGYTQPGVAEYLTERGHQISKQGVSHWEQGRNVPDALVLRLLARLYETTADSMLFDQPISVKALRIASRFDALPAEDRDRLEKIFTAIAGIPPANAAAEFDASHPDRAGTKVPQVAGRPRKPD